MRANKKKMNDELKKEGKKSKKVPDKRKDPYIVEKN